MLAIELTKAFNKIYRPLMWLNILKRGVRLQLVLFLMRFYERLYAYIEIDGERSEIFKLELDVNPTSPILFNFVAFEMIVFIHS